MVRRFADQQMNVFGHHHIAEHYPLITPPHVLQHSEEQVAARGAGQQGLAVIATKRQEMQIVSALPALQSPWHGCRFDGAFDSQTRLSRKIGRLQPSQGPVPAGDEKPEGGKPKAFRPLMPLAAQVIHPLDAQRCGQRRVFKPRNHGEPFAIGADTERFRELTRPHPCLGNQLVTLPLGFG